MRKHICLEEMIEYSGDCDRIWSFIEDVAEEDKDNVSMGLPRRIPFHELDDMVEEMHVWSKDFGEHVNRQLRVHNVVLSRHVCGNVFIRPGGKILLGVDRDAVPDLLK